MLSARKKLTSSVSVRNSPFRNDSDQVEVSRSLFRTHTFSGKKRLFHAKRSALLKIAAAWIITVPISGILAALIYYMIFGMVNA